MFNSLFEQVDSIIVRDPAARNRLEVITCYPGFMQSGYIGFLTAYGIWD
jgi:serine acetyltransferase